MLQILYDFYNSGYFGILFFIWVVIDVFWMKRWQSLFVRIGKIIKKPVVFYTDEKPDEPPLYPRVIMEQLAQRKINISNPESIFEKWLNSQKKSLFNSEYPFRTTGSIFLFISFVLFILADAISVAQTLIILGVGLDDLPSLFDRFDYAVLGGALLSAIIGIWMFADLLGESALIDTKMNDAQRRLWKALALFLFMSAFVVMASFAVQRLIALGKLPSNQIVEMLLDVVLYGLVPINNTLGAALCFLAAAQGFLAVLFLLTYFMLLIFPVMMFFVDILWRISYVIVDMGVWALFTPFMVIPALIFWVIGMLNPPNPQKS